MVQLAERVGRTALQLRGYSTRLIGTAVGTVQILEASGGGPFPTMVLLHGLGSMGVHYAPLLPFLRGHVRRLVVPDLPGHGFSDTPPPGTTLTMISQGLIEALDAVLTEPAVLFGNSLGGAAAIRYALARPERVRSLIVCSPAGASCDGGDLEQILGQFDFGTHAQALDFVDRLLTNPGPLRHFVAMGLRRRFSRVRVQQLVPSLSPNDLLSPEQLQSLTVPTMLIWGRNDRILPHHQLEFFREKLPPGTRIEEPAGVGHSPYLESPRLLARLILDFLRQQQLPARKGAEKTAAA